MSRDDHIGTPSTREIMNRGKTAREIVATRPPVHDAAALGDQFESLLAEVDAIAEPLVAQVMFAWARALLKAGRIMLDRQRKYGCTNIAGFGARGVVVRASDKLGRLKHAFFEDGATDTPDESLEDSFLDLTNYGAIGYTCLTGHWPGV